MIKKNIFSIIVSLIIMYLSLANSETFEKIGFFNIPYLDKFIHFGMYFVFMSVIIFGTQKIICKYQADNFWLLLYLFFMEY